MKSSSIYKNILTGNHKHFKIYLKNKKIKQNRTQKRKISKTGIKNKIYQTFQ